MIAYPRWLAQTDGHGVRRVDCVLGALKTLAYSVLKRIGELFPGPSKATRAYLHDEGEVEAALEKAGFRVTRRQMTATSFYFSRILECEREHNNGLSAGFLRTT